MNDPNTKSPTKAGSSISGIANRFRRTIGAKLAASFAAVLLMAWLIWILFV